jgi:hypothetical protein
LQVPLLQVGLVCVSPEQLSEPHDVPFGTLEWEQPDPGLQLSFVHALPSSQLSAVPAVQLPPWQVSVPLH